MTKQETKYINDLIKAREEIKQKNILLVEAIFLVSAHTGIHPKLHYEGNTIKEMLRPASMDFLIRNCNTLPQGVDLSDEQISHLMDFITEKQIECMMSYTLEKENKK